MKFSSKFNLKSMVPQAGGLSGYWISAQPTEVATAIQAGTGAGVPDSNGTPTEGTIVPGMIVVINTSGTLDLATSPDMSTPSLPILPFVVFRGDEDFSGAEVGQALIVQGPGRMDTDQFGAGVYTPGLWLTVSAGLLQPKVVGDHLQIVGMVGPRNQTQSGGFGATTTVLDVIMVQGVIAYSV